VLGNALSETERSKGAAQGTKDPCHSCSFDYENAHYNLGRVQIEDSAEVNDAKYTLSKALELDQTTGGSCSWTSWRKGGSANDAAAAVGKGKV